MKEPSARVREGAAPPMNKLRRIALHRQGLLRQAPFGQGKAAALRAIEHLGYVQIDTISVVERAHHHVLHSRVPNYKPSFLDQLQREGKVFEYWYHAAAYLPMRDYRFALRDMQAVKSGESNWVRSRDRKLMQRIRDRVRLEGPLRARDFEDPRLSRAGWWDWKPAKRALEQLFIEGDLMITGRDGFQKTYDLPERALPADVSTAAPSLDEFAAYLVANTLRSHGFATRKSFSHLRPSADLRDAVAKALEAGAAEGRLRRFSTHNGDLWWGDAELLDQRAPPAAAAVYILSPFDNAVILRHRVQSLFDFDYRVECYVKAENRRYGYFCLPILYRDRMVGRMDCKAHRAAGEFNIKQLHIEQLGSRSQGARGGNPSPPIDDRFLHAFAQAVRSFAAFNGCSRTTLSQCRPKRLQAAIAAALAG